MLGRDRKLLVTFGFIPSMSSAVPIARLPSFRPSNKEPFFGMIAAVVTLLANDSGICWDVIWSLEDRLETREQTIGQN